MVDNSWIKRDSGTDSSGSGATRIKIIATVIILLFGGLGVALLHNVGSSATVHLSEGILMDFGNYTVSWTDVDFSERGSDSVKLLDIASWNDSCSFKYEFDESSGVLECVTVGSTEYRNNDSDHFWGLWYIEKNSTEYVKSSSPHIDASNYKITAWAYTLGDEKPTVALDSTGTSIYGYPTSSRIVTLSPTATEIVGAMNAVSKLVGTDQYSDYPSSVNAKHKDGTIKVVGSYTSPSYESIMSVSPDIVICDGSQRSHVKMAESLRNSSVNSIVIYDGDDLKSVLDNFFVVGASIGYWMTARDVVSDVGNALKTLKELADGKTYSSMVALDGETSPYVAASDTYIDGLISLFGGENVFSDKTGWFQAISEYISARNPDVIIVAADKYKVSDYDSFISSLHSNWKSTTAYKEGRIYLLCEDLGTMAVRAGPRVAQLAELLGRIIDPSAFDDGEELPKVIGDDYVKYLTITKDLGYDN